MPASKGGPSPRGCPPEARARPARHAPGPARSVRAVPNPTSQTGQSHPPPGLHAPPAETRQPAETDGAQAARAQGHKLTGIEITTRAIDGKAYERDRSANEKRENATAMAAATRAAGSVSVPGDKPTPRGEID